MRKIKNIIILAGGDSTRFWPLTEKNLFSFLGRPLISHLIDSLMDYGENIIVVTNDVNKKSFNSLFKNKIKVLVQNQSKPGMAGAVIACKGKIVGEGLILNANDIFDFEIIKQLIERLDNKKSMMTLLAKKVEKYFPGGYLQLKKNKIVGIVEKPAPDKTPSDLVKLTCDYFSDIDGIVNVLDDLPFNTDDVYEKGLTKLIAKNGGVDYSTYKDYWYTLKYPWHLLQMMSYFLSTINRLKTDQSVKISSTAKIIGPVYFGKNVQVGDFSKVVGPCFIDDDTVVADYCLVRESHIGKRGLIGSFSEVTRSYLANNVMLHRNYVGDSVLDNEVEMGAQTVTANFRFDKKTVSSIVNGKRIDSNMSKLGTIIGRGSKLGVNSSVLPGVKIGKNSIIAPEEVISTDIPDNMFVFEGKTIKNKYNK